MFISKRGKTDDGCTKNKCDGKLSCMFITARWSVINAPSIRRQIDVYGRVANHNSTWMNVFTRKGKSKKGRKKKSSHTTKSNAAQAFSPTAWWFGWIEKIQQKS